jgi:hypothetical protein
MAMALIFIFVYRQLKDTKMLDHQSPSRKAGMINQFLLKIKFNILVNLVPRGRFFEAQLPHVLASILRL